VEGCGDGENRGMTKNERILLTNVPIECRNELHSAMVTHGSMKSSHEGYAVILEEVDELWEEVKKNPKKHPEALENMRKEAIQVAAMAMRFVIDVCDRERDV
jgi:hypothetical protein